MLAVRGSKSPQVIAFADGFRRDNVIETLMALDSGLRRIFRYRGEINEIIRTPEHMIDYFEQRGYIEGDCDDITTFVGSLLRALGFAVRFVAIRTDPTRNDFLHVFAECEATGTWIRFDETVTNETPLIYYGQRMVENL